MTEKPQDGLTATNTYFEIRIRPDHRERYFGTVIKTSRGCRRVVVGRLGPDGLIEKSFKEGDFE